MDETRRGSSEEKPLWETPLSKSSLVSPKRSQLEKRSVSETLGRSSEEKLPGETLVSGTRRGSSEEEPLWEALKRAGSEVKAWLECAPW